MSMWAGQTDHTEADYFDIETEPHPNLEEMLPPFDPSSVKVGNRKAEKADEYIEEKRKSYLQDARDKAALHAHTGRVLCVGYKKTADRDTTIVAGEEEAILSWFFGVAAKNIHAFRPMIGFNIHGFDLPFLVRRAWILGVSTPRTIQKGRYWDGCFIDLYEKWKCGEYQSASVGGMDGLCRLMGLAGKTENIGAKFGEIWHSDRERAEAYVRSDVEAIEAMSKRMGVVHDRISND